MKTLLELSASNSSVARVYTSICGLTKLYIPYLDNIRWDYGAFTESTVVGLSGIIHDRSLYLEMVIQKNSFSLTDIKVMIWSANTYNHLLTTGSLTHYTAYHNAERYLETLLEDVPGYED